MKDQSRMPTTLERLEEVNNQLQDWHAEEKPMPQEDVFNDAIMWLQWALNSLSARKQYHRKRALKMSLIKKMAETLLSEDELTAVDLEAERQLEETEHEHES